MNPARLTLDQIDALPAPTRVGNLWVWPDGLTAPVISGGAEGDPPPDPPADPPAPPADPPKSFSQDDLNRMLADQKRKLLADQPDLTELRQKAKQFDDLQAANQSELEKAQAAAATATKERDDALAKANETAKRTAVLVAAAAAGVKKPEQVFALLENGSVTVGDDGQVTGAEDAVKAFLADNPHFVGAGNGSGSADGGARGGSQGQQLTQSDLKSMSPEEIVKARREGRLADLLSGSNT